MRGKTLACSLVIVGSLWFGQWDEKPYGYNKTGYPTSALTSLGAGGSSSIYADATACWSFNDPTDLGNEDCTNTYDLTLVNTPTATGGALGYSSDFVKISSQYADGGDILDSGSGVSWGMAGWIVPTADVGTGYLISKYTDGATNGDFGARISGTGAADFVQCMLYDGTAERIDASAAFGASVTNLRVFFHCRFNATTKDLEAGADATWSGSAVTATGDGADTATSLNVAAYNDGSGIQSGNFGPVWFYRSASGGEVLTDAYTTSLYNSGKGKLCADTTETTNLVSCWDMSEDGGPYADSIGSNDLTAVNTPTQAAGLVERSDSGMTLHTVTGSSYVTDTLNWPSSYTLSGWVFRQTGRSTYQGAHATWVNQTSYAIIDNCASQTLYIGDGSASKNVAVAGACDDTWTHLTVWYDASDKKARINVNGGADNTTAALSGTLYTTSVNFRLGWAAGSAVGGDFDMYGLWTGIPGSGSVPTVAELYNAGAGVWYAAYWDALFNDGLRFAWSAAPEQRRIYVR